MSITVSLTPDEERRLLERASRSGKGLSEYVRGLIERDIKSPTLDEVLTPVRRQFEESDMTDEDLATLVEEAREEIWQEKHGRPSKAP